MLKADAEMPGRRFLPGWSTAARGCGPNHLLFARCPLPERTPDCRAGAVIPAGEAGPGWLSSPPTAITASSPTGTERPRNWIRTAATETRMRYATSTAWMELISPTATSGQRLPGWPDGNLRLRARIRAFERDRDHQDPPAAVLRGRTAHPIGTPESPCFPSAGLGRRQFSRRAGPTATPIPLPI